VFYRRFSKFSVNLFGYHGSVDLHQLSEGIFYRGVPHMQDAYSQIPVEILFCLILFLGQTASLSENHTP
jgi:hypothetical protein